MSADTVKALAGFKHKRKLNFSLLSDPQHEIIEKYDAWRMKKFMGRSYKGIARSTFLIDGSGKVEAIWAEAPAKGHAAEVLARLST